MLRTNSYVKPAHLAGSVCHTAAAAAAWLLLLARVWRTLHHTCILLRNICAHNSKWGSWQRLTVKPESEAVRTGNYNKEQPPPYFWPCPVSRGFACFTVVEVFLKGLYRLHNRPICLLDTGFTLLDMIMGCSQPTSQPASQQPGIKLVTREYYFGFKYTTIIWMNESVTLSEGYGFAVFKFPNLYK